MPPVAIMQKPKTIDLRGRRRLATAQLEAINQVGRHPLDDLLYFAVQKGGTRGYELRFLSPETGKRRDMTIGRFPDVDPNGARELAAQARALLARGIDPLEERRRQAERVRSGAQEVAFTLRLALAEHYAIESARWRNEKYRSQWLDRMHSAFGPLLDRLLVDIRKGELHDRLVDLNRESHDAAIKARANLDKVYRRFSGTRGLPEAHNPAAAMVGLLPRTKPVRHHPALNWRKAREFVAGLRDSNTWISVRLGFEWLVLSGARTNAVTHARWSQIDDAANCWHADPDESENKRRGDVPLTPRMREILDAMKRHRVTGTDWIFPSAQRRARSTKRRESGHPPISNEAFRQVLVRMRIPVTGHGFRSTFKTWAVESPQGRELRLPEVILEAAIGHSEGDAIKAAYTRADYWDMRIALANAWHDYLYGAALSDLGQSTAA